MLSEAEKTIDDLAHFAWCALIALNLARKDGKVRSGLSTHTFLLNWISKARRQSRFPLNIYAEIDELVRISRQRINDADLERQLEQIWQTCSDPTGKTSELFRLVKFIEHLKNANWNVNIVTDAQWNTAVLNDDFTGSPALFVRESVLVHNFSDQGKLIRPVELLISQHGPDVDDLFKIYNVKICKSVQHKKIYVMT